MLFLPKGGLPPKKNKMGYARGHGPSGHWLRARASVVNANTPAMTRWRNLFGAAKMNYKAAVAGTNPPPPGSTVSALDAWTILAETYFGILSAGLYYGGLQLPTSLTGCSSTEAFEVMVSTTLGQLGLPTPTAPPITETAISTSFTSANTTAGSYTLTLETIVGDVGDPLNLFLSAEVSIPGNVAGTIDWSASSTVAGVTATPSATSTPLAYNVFTGTSIASVYVTIAMAVNTAAASGSATLSATTPGGTASIDVPYTVAATEPIAAPVAPFFQLPTYLSANAVYDDTYTVKGIYLKYDVPDTSAGVMQRYGLTLAQQWIVTASAAYTSSYGVPAASTWTPISYNGLVYTNTTDNGPAPATTPDDILTAWTKVNGPLPSFGKIKFQVQPVDPVTGCPGPALSCTFEWQNGTLLASLIGTEGIETPEPGPAWWGPSIFLAAISGPLTVNPGTPLVIPLALSGDRAYSGTVTFTAKSKSPVPNGNSSYTSAIPPGVTFDFSPTTITDPALYPYASSCTLTVTADAVTSPQWSGNIDIEASDGVITAVARFNLQVNGPVILPNTNFLTIAPPNSTMTSPPGATTTALLTLSNTGPDDIFANMLSGSVNPNVTAEFGTGDTATATATATSITFALATGAATNALIGQALSSAGYSPDGYNVADATVIANDASTITVASTDNPATMTTAGVAAIINPNLIVPAGTIASPGTVETYIFVTSTAGNEMAVTPLQVLASAGLNDAYAAIFVSSAATGALTIAPTTTSTITTRLTPWIFTFTLSNTAAPDVTLALSVELPEVFIDVVFSSPTVFVPGGTPLSPGTATFNVTVTVELGPGAYDYPVGIVASAPGISLLGTIPVNVT